MGDRNTEKVLFFLYARFLLMSELRKKKNRESIICLFLLPNLGNGWATWNLVGSRDVLAMLVRVCHISGEGHDSYSKHLGSGRMPLALLHPPPSQQMVDWTQAEGGGKSTRTCKSNPTHEHCTLCNILHSCSWKNRGRKQSWAWWRTKCGVANTCPLLMHNTCGPGKTGEQLSKEEKCRPGAIVTESFTGFGEGPAPLCSFYFSPTLSLACLNCHCFGGGSMLSTIPAPTMKSTGTAALLPTHQMAEFPSKDNNLFMLVPLKVRIF